MNYKAVLFDFDYTLGDSTGPIVHSYTAALTELGFPAPDRDAVRATIGHTLQDGYTMLTGDRDEVHREAFVPRFKGHSRPIMVRDSVLCPGAEDVLHWLWENGVRTGMVSTKGSEQIAGIFEKYGLREGMELIIGGQDVTKNKPDPEGLNLAVERMALDRIEILFCGDTVIDAETARRAGVDFCAVLNGTTPAEAFGEYPKVHIAPDLADLLSWLQKQ